MKHCLKLFLMLVLLSLLSIPVSAESSSELRVSAIPDEAPEQLAKKYAPLVRYLKKELGMEVRYVPASNYDAAVEMIASKSVDLIWYGGFTAVQAIRRAGSIPIIQREEDAQFRSKFIARAGSGIEGLKDIKGKTFSFGSISSTSGHLMPRYFLMKEGINPEKDFSNVNYSGAHDATVKAVESGKADAGVLAGDVWERLVKEKKVNTAKVKAIWTTPPYYDYNWTVGKELDKGLVEKIKAALLKLDHNNPEYKEILDLMRTKRFIPTKPANYKAINEAAIAAGLLK